MSWYSNLAADDRSNAKALIRVGAVIAAIDGLFSYGLFAYQSAGPAYETSRIPLFMWFAWFCMVPMVIFEFRRVKAAMHRPKLAVLYVILLGLDVAFIILMNATLFQHVGIRDVARNHITHSGFDAFYLSAMTITTVGYGDFVPATQAARWFALTEALLGYFLLAMLIATLVQAARGPKEP